MFYLNTKSLLQLTAGTVGLELTLFAWLLVRRKLFRWSTAGFWSWAAFLLYFVLVPLSIAANADYLRETEKRLYLSGGIEQGLWVLGLVVAGIAAFFVSYMRTAYKPVTWRLEPGPQQWNLPSRFSLLVFSAFGMYSLLAFRTGLFSSGGEKLIVGGRFMGDVTGYQNSGYTFLFVPTLLLLLSQKRRMQILGGFVAAIFLITSLPHAWSRFVTISFVLALSLVLVIRKSKPWPGLHWLVGLFLIAALFQLRGHSEWQFDEIAGKSVKVLSDLPQKFNRILGSADTGMLTTWYVESYYRDTWLGYDYGIPILNYILTGWIPSRVFPDKYFLIDWVEARWNMTNYSIVNDLFFGAKSTLFGSFYTHGGWIGVLLGGILAGYLCRRLDGMLGKEVPSLVKSVAIAWLSVLWMVWASSTTWGLMTLGTMALPALAVWFFTSKVAHTSQDESPQTLDYKLRQAYFADD